MHPRLAEVNSFHDFPICEVGCTHEGLSILICILGLITESFIQQIDLSHFNGLLDRYMLKFLQIVKFYASNMSIVPQDILKTILMLFRFIVLSYLLVFYVAYVSERCKTISFQMEIL